ncbi:MAG: hypothetical protein ACK41T_07340 [Pseudobdellovibrio sp.]
MVKIKNRVLVMLVSLIHLCSSVAWPSGSTSASTGLQYEQCQQVKVGNLSYPDPACVKRNQEISKVKSDLQSGQYQQYEKDFVDKAPEKPVYKTCAQYDYQCTNENIKIQQQYNRDVADYNEAKNGHGGGIDKVNADNINATEVNSLANQKDTSAAGTMKETENKSKRGQQIFTALATGFGAAGAAKMIQGAACSAQCAGFGGGCCAMTPVLIGAGVALYTLMNKAKTQSNHLGNLASQACLANSQLSSNGNASSCQQSSTTGQQTAVYDSGTGACTPADSDACKILPSIGTGGVVTNNKDGTNGMIGTDPKSLYTLLPDGSVKTKNGKIYKPSDFENEKSMMAAGFTAAQAKELNNMLYGKDGIVTKADLNVKEALKGLDTPSGGGFDLSGGTNVVNVDGGLDSGKTYGDKLGEAKKEIERAPSSQGLSKEFNGELIGVPGDDIFLMINRRYKLKSEQDSFIVPVVNNK